MMTPETRGEIVRHAIRWALNILVEVQGNHGRFLTDGTADHLRQAISHLAEASAARMSGLPTERPPPTDAPGPGWPPDPRRKKR